VTHLEQTLRRAKLTPRTDAFRTQYALTCRVMVVYYIKNRFFLSMWHFARLACSTSLANVVHLHATHLILVIGIDEFNIYSSIHLIQRASSLPVPCM